MVLLAAGKGDRLKPITNSIPKLMIPVAGKPFLEYVINDLTKIGIQEICIVIGYFGKKISDYFDNGTKFNVKINYVEQKNFDGTATATYLAKDFVSNENFLLYLADTLIPNDLGLKIREMLVTKSDIDILSSEISPNKLKQSGSIETKGDYVFKVSEKSTNLKTNLGWAGILLFKNNLIFKLIEDLPSSSSGEYNITEVLNLALSSNLKIRNHICKSYIDSGTPEGMIDAIKFILKNRKSTFFNQKQSTNLTIREPIYFGNNCSIGKNITLGPFTSVGNNVILGDNITIEKSLVLDNTKLSSNKKFKNSIISNDGLVTF